MPSSTPAPRQWQRAVPWGSTRSHIPGNAQGSSSLQHRLRGWQLTSDGDNVIIRGEKGHRSVTSSCWGLWLWGRAGESPRPRALQHRPARVSNSAVGQVGACHRLLSQCLDLHGDKGNMRSEFKIYSASCSSLGLRKRERDGSERSDGEWRFAETLSPAVLWVRRLQAHDIHRGGSCASGHLDVTLVGDKQGCSKGILWAKAGSRDKIRLFPTWDPLGVTPVPARPVAPSERGRQDFPQSYLTAERLRLGSQGPSEAGSPSGRRWRHLGRGGRERGVSGLQTRSQEGRQCPSAALHLVRAFLSHSTSTCSYPNCFLPSQPPSSHPTLLQEHL